MIRAADDGVGINRDDLAVCPKSHEIMLGELTTSKESDARVAKRMIKTLPKRTKRVYGDGAYDQDPFYEELYKQSILCQNAQSYAPRKSMRGEIAEAMRSILNCPNLEMAQEVKKRTIEKYRERAPEFTKWLEENVGEGLTVY